MTSGGGWRFRQIFKAPRRRRDVPDLSESGPCNRGDAVRPGGPGSRGGRRSVCGLAVDLKTGIVTPYFVAGGDIAAVVPLKDGRFALTTAPDENLIAFFDRHSGAVVGSILTDRGPDAATLDPATGDVYVMNGAAGTISVVDPVKRAIIRKIAVGGALEAAALDGKGHLFVNVEDRAQVAVVDIAAGRAVARIALPGCKRPTGIAVDPASGIGYSVCGNGRLQVIDTVRRRVLTHIVVAGECGGLALDGARRRLHASSGTGVLDVISIADARRPQRMTSLSTKRNARTVTPDPATGRVYVAGGPYEDEADKTSHFEVLGVDAR